MPLSEFIELPEVVSAFKKNDGDKIWELVGKYKLNKDFANLLIDQGMLDDFLKQVTIIPDGAFGWCESLKSITISNSAIEIGVHAFYDCKSLESITIPKKFKNIKKWQHGVDLGKVKITYI